MTTINSIEELKGINFELIPEDDKWSFGESKEHPMHRIHAYPAKFPGFIAEKAIDFALDNGVVLETIADTFCGCGTVALAAKQRNFNFWGVDINPVATLIANSKLHDYDIFKVEEYYKEIKSNLLGSTESLSQSSNSRIQYWFNKNTIGELSRLLESINTTAPEGKYRDLFLTVYSSILKTTSKWLSKSIKPQVDPNKIIIKVTDAFERNYNKTLKALKIASESSSNITIETNNFLNTNCVAPKIDLLVTSPPYVTSYEYADLHQLSTLWLGFTEDYKELRQDTIGSLYKSGSRGDVREGRLNQTVKQMILNLNDTNISKTRINSIITYYLDMQNVVKKIARSINNNGMVVFVIGDTEYKGIKITNAKHLVECLLLNNIADIKLVKRKISNKSLTPYRDKNGRFTKDKNARKIYSEEFVVIGRKFDA
ncbi:DNA adenine methylase [Mycoplasmatota bacterium]|nr:DNA adenine methylase [Mycoplasmatota bacterium]